MRCKHCHELLALEMGGDLDEREQATVQRHLAQCPECRAHREKLEESTAALQAAAVTLDPDNHRSLWPGLAKLIQPVAQAPAVVRRSANQFNGWIPALVVAVACLLILSFSGQQGREMMEEPGLNSHPIYVNPSDTPFQPGILQPKFETFQPQPVPGFKRDNLQVIPASEFE